MKKKYNPNPAVYTVYYNTIREVALKYSYATCLHGSLLNDLDIVLIPWTHDTTNPIPMLLEIRDVTKGVLFYQYPAVVDDSFGYIPVVYPDIPTVPKQFPPHGRECWSIRLTDTIYIDISIMPLLNIGSRE